MNDLKEYLLKASGSLYDHDKFNRKNSFDEFLESKFYPVHTSVLRLQPNEVHELVFERENECWLVSIGFAELLYNNVKIIIKENDSIYSSLNDKIFIKNISQIELVLVSVEWDEFIP